MGRFVTVQSYGDNNPSIAALSYEKASGGRVAVPGEGATGKVKTERVNNVSGSTAGAGSNNFHEYRGERAREFNRLKRMDEESTKEQLDAAFALRVATAKADCERKTALKAAKRRKRKEALAAKKRAGGAAGGAGAGSGAGDSSDDSDAREPRSRPTAAPSAELEEAGLPAADKRRRTAATAAEEKAAGGEDSGDSSC